MVTLIKQPGVKQDSYLSLRQPIGMAEKETTFCGAVTILQELRNFTEAMVATLFMVDTNQVLT